MKLKVNYRGRFILEDEEGMTIHGTMSKKDIAKLKRYQETKDGFAQGIDNISPWFIFPSVLYGIIVNDDRFIVASIVISLARLLAVVYLYFVSKRADEVIANIIESRNVDRSNRQDIHIDHK